MEAIIILWFVCTVQALCLAFAVSKITKSNEKIAMIDKSEKINDYTEALEKVQDIEESPSFIEDLKQNEIIKKIITSNKKKKEEEEREKSLFEKWVSGESIHNHYL